MELANEDALKLTIIYGENDQFNHHPLYVEIVKRAHSFGIAGATVVRGIESFGRTNHIHSTRILSLSSDLPIVITMIDLEDKIREFYKSIADLLGGGIAFTENVSVLHYKQS
jgi:PII-like signaling protein